MSRALRRLVLLIVDLLAVLLAVRFVARIFGGDALRGLIGLTQAFVAPFRGLVADTVPPPGAWFEADIRGIVLKSHAGAAIEWGTLIAIAALLLLGHIVVGIFWRLFPPAPSVQEGIVAQPRAQTAPPPEPPAPAA